MKYELLSIGDGQTLVSYSNGDMEIINDDQISKLPNNSFDEIKSNKVYFDKMLSRLIEEYTQAREEETSKVDERVQVVIKNEKLKWSKQGVDFLGEYEIVGCNSNLTHSVEKIEVKGMLPAWKNIDRIYRSLLQLWFSGYHATPEDEYIFKEAMEGRF